MTEPKREPSKPPYPDHTDADLTLAGGGMAEFFLQIALPGQPISEMPLTAARCTLGREAGNDVVLDDRTVSRKHAELEHREDGYWIRNLSASSPALVNGKPVQSQRLRPGDRITLGSVSVHFKSLHGDARAPVNVKAVAIGAGGLLVLILLLTTMFSTDSTIDTDYVNARVARVATLARMQRPTGEYFALSGHGTCWAWQEPGYVVTNRHVTSGGREHVAKIARDLGSAGEPSYWVYFSPTEVVEARLVGESEEFDLAVLEVERESWPYLEYRSIDTVAQTEAVWACGFPGAADELPDLIETERLVDLRKRGDRLAEMELLQRYLKKSPGELIPDRNHVRSMTDGTVNALREQPVPGTSLRVIQTNTDINPGNSGGPLLTADERVVGVNTYGMSGAQGVNFALAIDDLVPEIERIIAADRERAGK